jgi:hypothetical protein
MSLFVHITDNCAKDAKSVGSHDALLDLVAKIEREQRFEGLFETAANSPYRIRNSLSPRKESRLIAQAVESGEHSVLVMLGIMSVSHRDYEKFKVAAREGRATNYDDAYTEAEIAAIVQRRLATDPVPEKPAPTAIEYDMIFSPLSEAISDVSICETRDWMESFASKEAENRRETIFNALGSLKDDDKVGGALHGVDGLQIWSRLFEVLPEGGTDQAHLQMRLLVKIGKEGEIRKDVDSAVLALMDKPSPVAAVEVLRVTQRCYPELILGDKDFWMDVQRDPRANLALSSEELAVLRSAQDSAQGFPLFINGRAGSGKTTILQYLFAEYAKKYLEQQEAESHPVYFTASSDLLDKARDTVHGLLRSNAPLAATGSRDIDRSKLDPCFKEFHGHMHALLPAESRKRFDRSARVTYPVFRKLWEGKFGQSPEARRNYDSAVSWHVIRSYIKGMDPERLFEAADYADFHAKQKSVSDETYQLVERNVWPWYRDLCEERSLWDDQDLTRHLLEKEVVLPDFTAIFCDEAQDFTRSDLEILFRSSTFAHRRVDRGQLNKVPFVFAGDQFQTINPTGFRWEAIKAMFVAKFVHSLSPGVRESAAKLNYKVLNVNYRSTANIVKFCNLVQALRARLFGLTDVLPQKSWTGEAGAPSVTAINPDDSRFWDEIRKNKVAVIVPCGEEGERDYIESNPTLKRHVKYINGSPDIWVLSTSHAKGLEFPVVVVYGFAREAEAALVMEAMAPGGDKADEKKELSMQYFLNRLYVAVSRAKSRLIIADEEKELKGFWSFAMNTSPQAVGQILANIREGEAVWRSEVSQMLFATKVEITERVRADDQLAQAESMMLKARAAEAGYLMGLAANAFQDLGKLEQAERCRGEAHFFEGAFASAAEHFILAKEPAEALRCFWLAGPVDHAERIVELGVNSVDLKGDVRVIAAEFMLNAKVKNPTFAQGAAVLKAVSRSEGLTQITHTKESVRWREFVDFAEVKLGALSSGPTDWVELLSSLEAIHAAQPEWASASMLATACFRAERWPQAATYYEKANATKSREYALAKARSTAYPERLAFLEQLGQHDDIIRDKQSSRTPDDLLKPEHHRAIMKAYLAKKMFREALGAALLARHAAGVVESVEALKDSKEMIPSALCLLLGWGAHGEDTVKRQLTVLRHKSDAFDYGYLLKCPRLKEYAEGTREEIDRLILQLLASNPALVGYDRTSATTPFRRNYLKELIDKTYYREAEKSKDNFTLAVAVVLELIDDHDRAYKLYELVTAEGAKDVQRAFAWERWTYISKKLSDAHNNRDQDRSTRYLEAAKMGLPQTKYQDFGAIPATPGTLEGEYLLAPAVARLKDFSAGFILDISGKTVSPGVAPEEKPMTDMAPVVHPLVVEPDRIPRSVKIGDIEIRYVPRKKVIIEHQGRLAEYHFDKLKALSHDEGFLDADGLRILELGIFIGDLGPRTVRIEVGDHNFAIEYNFDA